MVYSELEHYGYCRTLKEFDETYKRNMKKIHREALLGITTFLGAVGAFVGILVYFSNEHRNEHIESCIQSAEQQRFSQDLCYNDCFRDNYFELQRGYKIDDLDLVYRIAKNKCREND